MDDDGDNPFEIDSFDLGKALKINSALYLNKKRKLQAEQLGLPIPKHKCWDHGLHFKPLSPFEEDQEVEQMILHKIEENEERQAIVDESDHESAKDSTSFIGDSGSSMSVHGEAKFETQLAKIWPCDRPSTSSLNLGANSFKDTQSFLDNATAIKSAGKEELSFVEVECDPHHHYNGLKISQNLEEPILEFGGHLEYSCAEYENESIEQCTDELEDILYSNRLNTNIYVLSSGRWSINQDAQPDTRKPTIDQEFEQYFSMLML